jgi:hypothetical protein
MLGVASGQALALSSKKEKNPTHIHRPDWSDAVLTSLLSSFGDTQTIAVQFLGLGDVSSPNLVDEVPWDRSALILFASGVKNRTQRHLHVPIAETYPIPTRHFKR